MDATVCFIIPVLNEAGRIAALLTGLRARFPGAQLVVVDGGSGDDTVRQAMRHCDQLLLGQRGRAAQMNLGAAAAAADYLFFLHADGEPGIDGTRLGIELARAPDWGFSRVRLSGRQPHFRVIEWFINRRSRLTHVATGDQMLFVRRDIFAQTGGFDDIPLMEDVAYCKRLRALAPPLILSEPVLSSSRRWEEGGVAATVLRMWALRLAYVLGVSPQRLWRHYYGG
ncbi:MAG: TIGR04283 family arsenosugar biosynthesis glycosyltransferase [Halioglobus sp.]|nr:TIGR04283 family arsenosugar biosynthesis glycosyltransferase [Halioglobus sp.]